MYVYNITNTAGGNGLTLAEWMHIQSCVFTPTMWCTWRAGGPGPHPLCNLLYVQDLYLSCFKNLFILDHTKVNILLQPLTHFN